MAGSGGWYYLKNGETQGPVDEAGLIKILPEIGGAEALVFGPGLTEWAEARHLAWLARSLDDRPSAPKPPSKPRVADEIDYEIFGDDMQFVEVTLDPGEVVIAEAGALMYMSQGIQMQTVFGDPSKQAGMLGKLFDAGRRMISGESLFLTTFGAISDKREQVAFASPYPGKIVPVHIDELGGEILCQKSAFLCAARGVQVDIAFTKRFGAGLFGGEGFILQRLRGDGLGFLHAGGTVVKRKLAHGENLRLDTGCLVALQPSVDYDINFVGGIKNSLFGGEGLFMATLTGPGAVWLQSLPFSRLADRVLAGTRQQKGEGSVLGGIANVFESR